MGLRRAILFWAFCLAVGAWAGLVVGNVDAGNPHYAFAFSTGGGQSTGVIEQQSPNYVQYGCAISNDPRCDPTVWVRNPGVGIWSGYDYHDIAGGGTLDPGSSASVLVPVVLDNISHPVIVGGQSVSCALIVTLTMEDTTQPVRAVPIKGGCSYSLSTRTEGYADLSTLPEIAGSNGGRGEVIDVTVSVSNPTSRATRGSTQIGLCIDRAYSFSGCGF